jgi:hypothetical protein
LIKYAQKQLYIYIGVFIILIRKLNTILTINLNQIIKNVKLQIPNQIKTDAIANTLRALRFLVVEAITKATKTDAEENE